MLRSSLSGRVAAVTRARLLAVAAASGLAYVAPTDPRIVSEACPVLAKTLAVAAIVFGALRLGRYVFVEGGAPHVRDDAGATLNRLDEQVPRRSRTRVGSWLWDALFLIAGVAAGVGGTMHFVVTPNIGQLVGGAAAGAAMLVGFRAALELFEWAFAQS